MHQKHPLAFPSVALMSAGLGRAEQRQIKTDQDAWGSLCGGQYSAQRGLGAEVLDFSILWDEHFNAVWHEEERRWDVTWGSGQFVVLQQWPVDVLLGCHKHPWCSGRRITQTGKSKALGMRDWACNDLGIVQKGCPVTSLSSGWTAMETWPCSWLGTGGLKTFGSHLEKELGRERRDDAPRWKGGKEMGWGRWSWDGQRERERESS